MNNISKLLERLFLSRIQHHVSTCSHFNPYQFAYGRNHSTETSLLLTTDQIFNSINQPNSTLLVSLDLSAAFDTIVNHILLDRLHIFFGICNTVLDWLSSFLENRKQFVSFGHSHSITTTCTTGMSVALSDKVKLLGVTLDRHLTFDSHIAQVCRLAHFHTRALRYITNVISNDTVKSVAQVQDLAWIMKIRSCRSIKAKYYNTSESKKSTRSSGDALQSLQQCYHPTSKPLLATY